jgi:hypothetical protein
MHRSACRFDWSLRQARSEAKPTPEPHPRSGWNGPVGPPAEKDLLPMTTEQPTGLQDSDAMRGVWFAALAVVPFWVALLGVVIR